MRNSEGLGRRCCSLTCAVCVRIPGLKIVDDRFDLISCRNIPASVMRFICVVVLGWSAVISSAVWCCFSSFFSSVAFVHLMSYLGDKALPCPVSVWLVCGDKLRPSRAAAAAVDTNKRAALMNCQLLLTASHLAGSLCSCEDQSHGSPLKILPVEASG